MSKEPSRFRPKLIPFLCGACLALIVSELFPVFSIGFWRVAYASEFAPGFVGPGGSAPSSMSVLCQRLGATPAAALTYRLLYFVGNPQGKAYALMGLREIDWPDYQRLRDDYVLSSGNVTVHTGCLINDEPVESAVTLIEIVSYPPGAQQTEAMEKLDAHFKALRAASKR